MQIRTNFPAKSLSIYTKSFSWQLSNDLTETYLIKLNKNLYLITLSETIKITKNEYFGESIINQIYKRQDKIMNNFYWQLYDYNKRWWNKIQLHKAKKKKKRRMRIFEHRIFSKSFGGKIHHNWTDVTYRIIKQINWRMRILGARIFSKFFGGKILNF